MRKEDTGYILAFRHVREEALPPILPQNVWICSTGGSTCNASGQVAPSIFGSSGLTPGIGESHDEVWKWRGWGLDRFLSRMIERRRTPQGWNRLISSRWGRD